MLRRFFQTLHLLVLVLLAIPLALCLRGGCSEAYFTGFENFAVGNDKIIGTDSWVGSDAGAMLHGIMDEAGHGVLGIGNAAFLGGFVTSATHSGTNKFVYVRRPVNLDPVALNQEVATFSVVFGIKDSTSASLVSGSNPARYRRDNFEFLVYNQAGLPLAGLQFDNTTLDTSVTPNIPRRLIYRLSWNASTATFHPGVVHTVAFDFDDTIIDTYMEKIDAWVFAIDETLMEQGMAAKLIPGFSNKYGSTVHEKRHYMKRLVDEYPGKDDILKHILRDDTATEVFDRLEDRRSGFRRNALFPAGISDEDLSAHVSAKLFQGVKVTLDCLVRAGYTLAIASLTDEERIERTLNIANIECIDTIVARSEYRNRELSHYLAEKIHLIRKIANLAGIPVSRVLYIGDHHRDEHAALEVGASFIQARLLKDVEPSVNPETLCFEDYGQLPGLIDAMESRVRGRESSSTKPMHYV